MPPSTFHSEATDELLHASDEILQMLKQRRAAITPHFAVGFGRQRRAFGQNRAMHEQPTQRIRNVDDERIHEEFLQIDPHFLGCRGVGRAQIDE